MNILDLIDCIFVSMKSGNGLKVLVGLVLIIAVYYACRIIQKRKSQVDKVVPSDYEQEFIEGPYLAKLKTCLPFSMRFPRGPSKIEDFLYLGGEVEATNRKLMKDLGITHVINCASGYISTGEPFYGDGIKYMGFDAEDEPGYDIMQHYEDVYKFIEEARMSGGKAFIHCIMGVNRSGALVVAYMMQHRNIGPISAATLVRKSRGLILSNYDFQEQVITFARKNQYLQLDKHLVANI